MKLTTIIAENNYAPAAVNAYKALGDVYFWFDLNEKEREEAARKADILVVRLALTVNKELINKMPNLKAIATSTTGLNHIDMDYAKEKGIEVISLRGHTGVLEAIPSTAEQTIGLMLALIRKIPWSFEDVKKGNWNPNNWTGYQLKDKTLGILGLGRLGKIVAQYAKAFGMNVIAHDPNIDSKIFKELGIQKVGFEELFKNSEIVSLHINLTNDTYGLIKERHLKMMKKMEFKDKRLTCLINTARAELIEKGALEKALKEKWIDGAAIDVMQDERDDNSHLNSILFEYAKNNNNLLITPHIGGTTIEGKMITQNYIADLVKKHFE